MDARPCCRHICTAAVRLIANVTGFGGCHGRFLVHVITATEPVPTASTDVALCGGAAASELARIHAHEGSGGCRCMAPAFSSRVAFGYIAPLLGPVVRATMEPPPYPYLICCCAVC